jgi:hypothetical protein
MNKSALDGIVEATGRGVDMVAQVALTYVRSFLSENPLNYGTMAPHLQLISTFLSSKHEMKPLHLAMLYHKLLPVLVDALKLTNNDILSGESPSRDLYVKFCYSSIHAAMQRANGAALIAHALDVGLISAILKSGARLRQLPASFQDMMGQTIFRVLHHISHIVLFFARFPEHWRRLIASISPRGMQGPCGILGCSFTVLQQQS